MMQEQSEKDYIAENGDCSGCGNPLNPSLPENPALDFYRIVCSQCGKINQVSIIRQKNVKTND